MGVVVPEGEYSATFVFNAAGSTKDVTWNLGLVYVLPISPGDLATLVYEAFTDGTGVSDTGPFVVSAMLSDWTFQGVSVMEMTSSGPLVGQHLFPQVGGNSGQSQTMNCSYLATKNTALGGRKNRGRAYLPMCNTVEADCDVAGILEPTAVTLVQEYYDHAFIALDDSAIVPVLHHSDGSAGTPITSFVVGSKIATQRRRLR